MWSGLWTDTVVGHTQGTSCGVVSSNCTNLKWAVTEAGHTTPIPEIEPPTQITSNASLMSGLTVSVSQSIEGSYEWTKTVTSHAAGSSCSYATSQTDSNCDGIWNNTTTGSGGHTKGTVCTSSSSNCVYTYTTIEYASVAGQPCTTPSSTCVALESTGADGSAAAGTSCYLASTTCIQFYDLSVTISGDQDVLNSLFDNFDILWGTGDCSNDAIWGSVNVGTVPAPGALSLLSFGLIGFGLARRRGALRERAA